MAKINTDFLKFSAYSIKDLITRKLAEDTAFTDQIYEGSNLAILIDLVSYMYQCLIYQLNNAAAESMFADTQIYENINRLVKFIGYNPRGAKPAQMDAYIQNQNGALTNYMIRRYSCVDTGMSDSNGKPICFSTIPKTTGNDRNDGINDEVYHKVTLYNGKWRLYGTVFTASGVDYETFLLEDMKSDSDENQFVATNFINVYVEHEGEIQQDWYCDVNEIFVGRTVYTQQSDDVEFSKIYSKTARIYTIRLNEEKYYELKFSDGVTGQKLSEGDKVYIFYLDTNGLEGQIDIDEFPTGLKFRHDPSLFGMSRDLYTKIFGTYDQYLDQTQDYSIIPEAGTTVTTPQVEEDVEQIRENAPNWFKTGNRLITAQDYEYYIKNSYPSDIIDVKCMNNWEYLGIFYRWLYQYGQAFHGNGRYYLAEEKFQKNNCQFIDAADGNNTYLWIKTENSDGFLPESVKKHVSNIKTMTTEVEVLQPIDVAFAICAAPVDRAKLYVVDQSGKFTNFDKVFTDADSQDEKYFESYIEVTLDDSSIYIDSAIKNSVYEAIRDYFKISNCILGQHVNFSDILNKIYEINGVQKVRTVFFPKEEVYDENGVLVLNRYYDGLAFASWSTSFLETAEDMSVSNITRQLEDFQFPTLYDAESLMDKIKVVKKTISNIGTMKF